MNAIAAAPAIRLRRLADQPLLRPRRDIRWERGACLNSAVLYEGGKWHLFYRAIDHDPAWRQGQPGGAYNTSVGHATSDDGLVFQREPDPLIPFGFAGPHTEAQDCRIVKIGDLYYLTYCLYQKREGVPKVGWSVSRDLVTWEHRGELVPFETFGFNKNAALFPAKIGGRYALFHRPECAAHLGRPQRDFNWRTWSRGPLDGSVQSPGITLSFSDDLEHWTDTRVVMGPRSGFWDDVKIGPGAPPIPTEQGWLNVYHGVDAGHVYRLGLALHDLADPAVVLKRQAECILEPELEWELKGDVDGAIFTCGAVLRGTMLRVYYAGADTVLGAAEADIAPFLES
jgi:predicted GH43/DUF377 family glycosyl hydrolase